MTAGPSLRVHRRDLLCSRARDPGSRRKGEESGAAPRETLAQGAFQLCRLQRLPARSTGAPQLEAGRSYLLEPRNTPRTPHPDAGAPRISGWEQPGHPAGLRSNDIPDPQSLRYRRPPRGPAGGALPPRSPDGSRRSWWAAPGSRALRGPQARRQQKREPGRPAPERGAQSRSELPNEPGAARAPGPPSSAPESPRLSRPRGGAADSSRRLPAFSISPFAP